MCISHHILRFAARMDVTQKTLNGITMQVNKIPVLNQIMLLVSCGNIKDVHKFVHFYYRINGYFKSKWPSSLTKEIK